MKAKIEAIVDKVAIDSANGKSSFGVEVAVSQLLALHIEELEKVALQEPTKFHLCPIHTQVQDRINDLKKGLDK